MRDRLIVIAVQVLIIALVLASLGMVDLACHLLSGTGMWEL